MPLTIRRVGTNQYMASASPPESAEVWRTDTLFSVCELVGAVRRQGCRQTDVADALDAADPGWATTFDREVEEWRKSSRLR